MDSRLAFLNTPPPKAKAAAKAAAATNGTNGTGAATNGTDAPATSAPQRHNFEHKRAGAQGTAIVDYWPARHGVDLPPEHVLVFIPGNPGLADYYHKFLNNLYDQLPDSYAILTASHVGGDPSVKAPEEPLNIYQMTTTKVEFVEALQTSLAHWSKEHGADKPKVSISAHSMGTWMTVELLKRLRGIHAAYLLFPTLGWISNSHNGWKLWPIFHRPIRSAIPYLSHIAPYLPAYKRLPSPTQKLVSSFETIKHVLHLGHSEMEIIRTPDQAFYLEQRNQPEGRGVYGLWSAGSLDGWVGSDGPLIQSWLGEKRAQTIQAPHAFCISTRHSKSVADHVARWMLGSKHPDADPGRVHSVENGTTKAKTRKRNGKSRSKSTPYSR
ncbi:hypothetical protein Q8F55_005802 [Vanrija albida]|uniref:AB hydrolase-1 domain-containing protein n=1 Tax=Vanrija albida TaxID=181172 RepID=A0ABR3Q2L9_9TREE